jgi:hypothetical protein
MGKGYLGGRWARPTLLYKISINSKNKISINPKKIRKNKE